MTTTNMTTKLPGTYSQQEKIDALWHDKHWSECLRLADGILHGSIDESTGKSTGIRHAVMIDPAAVDRKARELFAARGF